MRLNQFSVGQRVLAPNKPNGGFISIIHSINSSAGYLELERMALDDAGEPIGTHWRCTESNGHVRSRGSELDSGCLRFPNYGTRDPINNSASVVGPITTSEVVASVADEYKDFTTGIEIEMYAPELDEIEDTLKHEFGNDGLDFTYDGSIHPPDGNRGRELRTHVMNKDTLEHDIDRICEVIGENGGNANQSCGLHVHLGSRNLTNEQLLNVAKTFFVLEPIIYAMQPKSRRKGGVNGYRYAKALDENPLTKYLGNLTMLEELTYQKRLKSSRGVKTKINKLVRSFGFEPGDTKAPAIFAKNYSMLHKMLAKTTLKTNLVAGGGWASRRLEDNRIMKARKLGDKYNSAKMYFTQKDSKGREVPIKDFSVNKLVEVQMAKDNEVLFSHFSRMKRDKHGKDRYFGLNFNSHFFRGTIEFRYHSGTVNAKKILNWVKFLHYAMDWATNRFDRDSLVAINDQADIMQKLLKVACTFQFPPSLLEHCRERITTLGGIEAINE